MNEASLLFETRGSVARLIHNRPEVMNALNLEIVSLFEKDLPRIATDDSIKVLVITGTGKCLLRGRRPERGTELGKAIK